MLLALVATVPARWGDGWGLDRVVNIFFFRKPAAMQRSRAYGYPIWLGGLTIALAYTTAGLSKYWITDGASLWDTGARWGFITDLNIAATDWALPIVNSYPLALGASLFACLGRVVYIASCFTRSYWIKLALGVFVALR